MAFTPDAPKPLDLVALGEAMVEFNQVDGQPPLYLQGFGGDTSNAAIAAARAGAKVAYLTRLGADAWGQALMSLWQQEGVDTSAVVTSPGQSTGIYFVHHDALGHRFTYARQGSAASCMSPQDLHQHWQTAIAKSRWLHVSGISLGISDSAAETVLQAMAFARTVGTQVALDSNLRTALWPLAKARATLSQAMRLCDVFLPSLDDLIPLSGLQDPQAIVHWCHDLGVATTVLKLGVQGALVSTASGLVAVPGHAVHALDATGAGDCFCGNFLARMVAGDDVLTATRWANAAAALSVQGRGAIAPLPHFSTVRQWLDALL